VGRLGVRAPGRQLGHDGGGAEGGQSLAAGAPVLLPLLLLVLLPLLPLLPLLVAMPLLRLMLALLLLLQGLHSDRAPSPPAAAADRGEARPTGAGAVAPRVRMRLARWCSAGRGRRRRQGSAPPSWRARGHACAAAEGRAHSRRQLRRSRPYACCRAPQALCGGPLGHGGARPPAGRPGRASAKRFLCRMRRRMAAEMWRSQLGGLA
jgi:hypothetical protein